jgi:murein DD-endopeptidase MepM/ murein hydrolase activator NlpD
MPAPAEALDQAHAWIRPVVDALSVHASLLNEYGDDDEGFIYDITIPMLIHHAVKGRGALGVRVSDSEGVVVAEGFGRSFEEVEPASRRFGDGLAVAMASALPVLPTADEIQLVHRRAPHLISVAELVGVCCYAGWWVRLDLVTPHGHCVFEMHPDSGATAAPM